MTSRSISGAGSISFSTLKDIFTNTAGTKPVPNMSQLYRGGTFVQESSRNQGIPTANAIKLSNFRNGGYLFLPAFQNTNDSATLVNNGSANTQNMNDKYKGEEMSFSITQNPYNSASLSGSTLTVTGARRNVSYNVTTSATNVTGTTSGYNLTISEWPNPPVGGSSVDITIIASATYLINNVAGKFNYTNGAYNTSFSVPTNPENNATLSADTLSILGADRDISYIVIVQASNVAGSANYTVNVTEKPDPPTLKTYTSSITGSASGTTYTSALSALFNGTHLTYTNSSTNKPASSTFTVNATDVTIVAYNNNVVWSASVTATNASGSVTADFTITEPAAITTWYYNSYYAQLYHGGTTPDVHDGSVAVIGISSFSAGYAKSFADNYSLPKVQTWYMGHRGDPVYLYTNGSSGSFQLAQGTAVPEPYATTGSLGWAQTTDYVTSSNFINF